MDAILAIIFFFLLIMLILRALGDPDWMPFCLRVGVPIYRKRFSIRSKASLSDYFQAIKKQISSPRIEFEQLRSNEYFIIIYRYSLSSHGSIQYSRPMVPVRFGLVRHDEDAKTIDFTGYLDLAGPTLALGFWLFGLMVEEDASFVPVIIGILTIIRLIDLASIYRFINKFLSEAIAAVERKNH
jgi:hypothetical protein